MPFIYRPLFFLIALMSYTGVYAQSSRSSNDGAVFSFQETVHDFGNVPTDTIVEYRFEFVNSGNKHLIINDVTLSCPCFTVDWTKGPVMPGMRGWLSVQYPTTGKPGAFDKILWIASNAINESYDPGRFELRIKGIVQKADTTTHRSGSTTVVQEKDPGPARRKRSATKHRKGHRK